MTQSYASWLAARQRRHGIRPADVAAALAEVCGPGLHVRRSSGGHSSVVFAVEGKPLVVRATSASAPAYEIERHVRRACADAGVPVPRILGLVHRRTPTGWTSFSVEERAPGRALSDALDEWGPGRHGQSRARRAVRNVGTHLARMWAIDPGGFGPVGPHTAGMTRKEYLALLRLRPEVPSPAYRRLGLDPGLVSAARDALWADADTLVPDRPALVHSDCRPDHWYVDGTTVVAVIDLESAGGGDPAADIAWWESSLRWSGRKEVHSLTAELLGECEQPGLVARLPLRRVATAVFCLNFWVQENRPAEAARAYAHLRHDLQAFETGSLVA